MGHSGAADRTLDLVGRDGAQALLLTALANTHDRVTVVHVDGDRGSGKTALLQWVARHGPQRADVVWCRGGVDVDHPITSAPPTGRCLVLVDDADTLATDTAAALRNLVYRAQDTGATEPLTLVVAGPVDPGTPLDAVLGDAATVRVELDPLAGLDAFAVVRATLGAPVSALLADELVAISGGLPAPLIRAACAALQHGLLHAGPDGLSAAAPLPRSLASSTPDPAAVRRLDKIGEASRRLMEIAACIGPSGPVAALGAAHDPSAGELDDLLDELAAAHVIDEDGSRYWFDDAELAHWAYSALPSRTRQQLHATIALRLLDVSGIDAQLVFTQVRLAGPKVDARTRLRACERAAGDAAAAGRWGAAAQALATAGGVTSLAAPDRLDLLMRWADALHRNDAGADACARYDEAIALATELGDTDRAGEAMLRSLSIRVADGLEAPVWHATMPDDDSLRAWFVALRANQSFATGDADAGFELSAEAVALARRSGIAELEVRASNARGLQHLLMLDLQPAAEAYGNAHHASERSADALVRAWPPTRLALIEWLTGDEMVALDRARAAAAANDRSEWWGESMLAHAVVSAAALSAGRLDDAERAGRRTVRLHHRSAYAFALPLSMPALAAAVAFAGDPAKVAGALDAWRAARRVPNVIPSLCAVMLGHHDVSVPPARSRRIDLFTAGASVARVELSDWLGRDDGRTELAPLLDLLDRGVVNCPGWPVPVPRAAALAAHMAGDHAAAVELTAANIARATTSGAVLSAAMSAFDAARWSDAGSLRPLAACVDEFERIGATSWVARAQRVLDGRPAASALAAQHAMRVLLYTDLVGSTPLNVRAGDVRFVELLDEHQAIIARCTAEHGGEIFHNTGDGFGMWFARAGGALGLRGRDPSRPRRGEPSPPRPRAARAHRHRRRSADPPRRRPVRARRGPRRVGLRPSRTGRDAARR